MRSRGCIVSTKRPTGSGDAAVKRSSIGQSGSGRESGRHTRIAGGIPETHRRGAEQRLGGGAPVVTRCALVTTIVIARVQEETVCLRVLVPTWLELLQGRMSVFKGMRGGLWRSKRGREGGERARIGKWGIQSRGCIRGTGAGGEGK